MQTDPSGQKQGARGKREQTQEEPATSNFVCFSLLPFLSYRSVVLHPLGKSTLFPVLLCAFRALFSLTNDSVAPAAAAKTIQVAVAPRISHAVSPNIGFCNLDDSYLKYTPTSVVPA